MVFDLHLISDPLFHHTWTCLHHFDYKEALFTAERIFAENRSDESVFLLATCLYHNLGARHAREFLQRQGIMAPKCRYLLAKCHIEIGQLTEAEDTLVGVSQEMESVGEIVSFYRDSAPFVLRILADIYKQTERRKLAINCLRKCLELNPLSWIAYTELIDLHDNVDPFEVFTLPKNVVFNNQSCLRALSNKINIGEIEHHSCPSKKRSDKHDSQEDLSVSVENVNPKYDAKLMDIVDNDISNVTDDHMSYSFNCSGKIMHSNPSIECQHSVLHGSTFSDSSFHTSPKSPCIKYGKNNFVQSKPLFGNAYLEPFTNISIFNTKSTNLRHIKNTPSKSSAFKDPSKKNKNKRISFNLKANEASTPYSSRYEKTNKNDFNENSLNMPKRNDYGSISSVPISPLVNEGRINELNLSEQNLDSQVSSSLSPCVQVALRTRLQHSKAKISSSVKECNHSADDCFEDRSIEPGIRLQSARHYLSLLIAMGSAYKCTKNYKLYDAISHINRIPKHHTETALVSSWLASIYLEMNDKPKACRILASSYEIEPWQLHGLPLYSSILWLLSKEKDLLYLSNEMLKMDRENAEVWCVLGNSMSFNKESEVAIRYFQRAIQLNPSYAYAYILLGHEYVTQEELDKALASYRRAFDLESHNYCANFFIATVYQKQDNYVEAEKLLKESLKMYPDSLMLLTNLAVVYSKLKQNNSDDVALKLLEKACNLYPNEPMCRFHKASLLYQQGRYADALTDLKLLEMTKEARVFLLMSMIYRHIGKLSKATVYNSWAIELDPKCSNDSFLFDRSCVGNVDSGNNLSAVNVNSGFLGGNDRNSESMQDDGVSDNQINYNLLETD